MHVLIFVPQHQAQMGAVNVHGICRIVARKTVLRKTIFV